VRRSRRRIGWELVVCGLRGHVLCGADAAELRPQDWLLARDEQGLRWCRCLRCDSWIALAPPTVPERQHPPNRDQIEIPTRGQALRDKIVLRLIAVDRMVHFLILGILGVAVLALVGHQHAARGKLERVLAALQNGVAGGPVQTKGHIGIVRDLDRLLSLQSHTLRTVGIALLAYALLEGIEAVGLWLIKRWAEYLTFVATALFLPLEIYEIVHRPSALKVIGFLINLAIVIYLVVAKRLFGIRGGGAVDERRRAADMSWEALEQGLPAPAVEA
jgi:uncharacterized membrane protein (DUF2068 family)